MSASSGRHTSTIGKYCSSLTDPLHLLLTDARVSLHRQGDGGPRAAYQVGVREHRLARGDGVGDVLRHSIQDELRESPGAMRRHLFRVLNHRGRCPYFPRGSTAFVNPCNLKSGNF